MTSLFAANGLLETTEGKPTTLLTGGGKWSPEEIKAMTPRRVTQAEYDLHAQQAADHKIKQAEENAYNMELVKNYKNNVKTFRIYDPITKTYSPPNK